MEKGVYLSIEKSAISSNCELITPLEEKKLLYQDLLKRSIRREARSELNTQEMSSKVETELFMDQLSDHSRREKNWLRAELGRRERVSSRDLQGTEELTKVCCTEAERAKQWRRDELYVQEKDGQSSVNQLVVQIQELQDKVNYLDDSRHFLILKLQAVLGYRTLPVILSVFRVFVECLASILAYSLTHGIHMVYPGNVFEGLRAGGEPTTVCFENSRSLAETMRARVSEYKESCYASSTGMSKTTPSLTTTPTTPFHQDWCLSCNDPELCLRKFLFIVGTERSGSTTLMNNGEPGATRLLVWRTMERCWYPNPCPKFILNACEVTPVRRVFQGKMVHGSIHHPMLQIVVFGKVSKTTFGRGWNLLRYLGVLLLYVGSEEVRWAMNTLEMIKHVCPCSRFISSFRTNPEAQAKSPFQRKRSVDELRQKNAQQREMLKSLSAATFAIPLEQFAIEEQQTCCVVGG